MLDVIRKNCTAGEITVFQFNAFSIGYMIKNFTDGDILVSYENPFNESQSAKIAAGGWQILNSNTLNGIRETSNTVTVKTSAAGEVEVTRTE